MSENPFGGPDHFPTTNWSLVRHAGDKVDEQQSQALQELLSRYWSALKAHVVLKRRMQPNDADDLVQGFIENKILERNLVGAAEPERGKFRSLLLKSLDNYVLQQIEKKMAKKREADRAAPLDPQETPLGQAGDLTPDRAFDVQWARQVVAEASERMEQECRQSDRGGLWTIFHGRILAPILEGAEPLGYDEIIEQSCYESPAQASNALMTGKRMYARVLRLVVSQYVADDAEIEEEIQDLQRIVAG
ncbi:MAG: hypothetical protein QGG36_22550 [Pirellulaceae bacterium]|jgi:RNA polymerase sigma-70 factor (ECF subfamily)|nr:hypothetical protein [Pirellulaceae bacterium]